MRIEGAEFVRGQTPTEALGPEVLSVDLLTATVWPGYRNKPIRGALGERATAATLALAGDVGYWIVLAGAPDVATPTLPSLRAVAAFASTLPTGALTLEVRAVDAEQHFGPPSTRALSALPAAPLRSGAATSLVVTLSWDTESDLDLHVVDPLGNEIYHGAPSSRDGFAPGAGSQKDGFGLLSFDSNGNCNIDGFRQESVSFSGAPPAGHYLVRVDTVSLCGQPNAHFTVRAELEGASLGVASGTALGSDAWGAHDRGAGVLALGFDVP